MRAKRDLGDVVDAEDANIKKMQEDLEKKLGDMEHDMDELGK